MSTSIDDEAVWGSDTPISMPVPSDNPILVNMGTLGFTEFGMAHNLNTSDLEDYIPTFLPNSIER